jgi:hypothetical protein
MHYPSNDPKAVMICSREREGERKEIRDEKYDCASLRMSYSNTLCKKICWYLMIGMRTLIDFGGCSMLLFKGGRRRPVGRLPSRRTR